jgi:hypothetical protein
LDWLTALLHSLGLAKRDGLGILDIFNILGFNAYVGKFSAAIVQLISADPNACPSLFPECVTWRLLTNFTDLCR